MSARDRAAEIGPTTHSAGCVGERLRRPSIVSFFLFGETFPVFITTGNQTGTHARPGLPRPSALGPVTLKQTQGSRSGDTSGCERSQGEREERGRGRQGEREGESKPGERRAAG